MKKAKIKERKELKEEIDTSISIRNGIIVILTILVIFIAFYLLTDYLISKNKNNSNQNPDTEEKETNDIIFNKLLSQEENEYYVFAILDENKNIYNIYTETLKNIYYIDMSDSFNKSHIGEETNITDTVKDIVISDSAFFHIKNGKIEEYKIGSEEILEYLKILIKVEKK